MLFIHVVMALPLDPFLPEASWLYELLVPVMITLNGSFLIYPKAGFPRA